MDTTEVANLVPRDAPFGTLLRSFRRRAGLSQEALAERSALSARGIADLERGSRRFPYPETVERLAVALGLNLAERSAFTASGQRKTVLADGVGDDSRRAAQGGYLKIVRSFEPRTSQARPHNLPAHLPTLIGREQAVTTVRRLLLETESGLLTLTGAGGVGKTRLALAVATDLVDHFADGVWLVDLAALTDATLVAQTVAAVFDLREMRGQPAAGILATTLRDRSLLMVLDNCEHLLDGCAQLVDFLLRACSELRVLATSREALGLIGEIAWRVPSLPVPDPLQLPPLGELERNPAVRLFVERAATVQPRFRLGEDNAAAVAVICSGLDGIPLALELAAARIEVLSVGQLAARLDHRFGLLTGGSRTAPPRQQTLRATLDWSYELLSEPEQHLFNRLSAFAGGWTLDAAEAVCSSDGIDEHEVLELLQRLVRKSLVVARDTGDGVVRFRLLETLRQYAGERLAETGELGAVQRRHTKYYAAAVGDAAEQHRSGEAWLRRLIAEHDNLRTALRWLLDHNETEQAMRLAVPLGDVWVWGGYLTEGQAYIRTLVALSGTSHVSLEWVRFLWTAGFVDFFAGDYATSRARWEEAVAAGRMIDDPLLARTLSYLGQVAREQEDYASAQAFLEESLSLCQATGNRWDLARTLNRLGTIAQALGDYGLARSRYEESLALARQNDDPTEVAWSLHNVACLALDQHDCATAAAFLAQSLAARMDFDNIGFVHGLAELSVLAAAEGRPDVAVRLAAATAALTQRTGISVQHSERGRHEAWLATARRALGESDAAVAWTEGLQLRLDQAVAHAQTGS